jgi:hypothetical protein
MLYHTLKETVGPEVTPSYKHKRSFKIQKCTNGDSLSRKITHNHISALVKCIFWWMTDVKIRHSNKSTKYNYMRTVIEKRTVTLRKLGLLSQ